MCSPDQASSPAAAASPNMAGTKAPLVIQNVALSPPQLKCVMHPCKPLPQDLAALLSAERVTAFGLWSPAPELLPAQHPLTVLHAMSGGERACRNTVGVPASWQRASTRPVRLVLHSAHACVLFPMPPCPGTWLTNLAVRTAEAGPDIRLLPDADDPG